MTFAALPRSDYALILADPPWGFETFNRNRRTPTQKKFREAPRGCGAAGAAEPFTADHYPTMSFEEMAALPVASIAAKNAFLAMWAVGSHLDEALRLAAAWGFPRYVTDLFYWFKQNRSDGAHDDLFLGRRADRLRISMGYHTRKQVEPCWLFKRGKGLPVLSHDVRQVILAPPREHSRKPPEQYARLEALYGGGENGPPRLELFSRTPHPGWDAWGNEVGKFAAVAEPQAKQSQSIISTERTAA